MVQLKLCDGLYILLSRLFVGSYEEQQRVFLESSFNSLADSDGEGMCSDRRRCAVVCCAFALEINPTFCPRLSFMSHVSDKIQTEYSFTSAKIVASSCHSATSVNNTSLD